MVINKTIFRVQKMLVFKNIPILQQFVLNPSVIKLQQLHRRVP